MQILMIHVPFAAFKFFPQEESHDVIYLFFFPVRVTVNLFVVVSELVSRMILDHPPSPDLPVRFRRCPSIDRSHLHVSTEENPSSLHE
jgi:hypothetical protein